MAARQWRNGPGGPWLCRVEPPAPEPGPLRRSGGTLDAAAPKRQSQCPPLVHQMTAPQARGRRRRSCRTFAAETGAIGEISGRAGHALAPGAARRFAREERAPEVAPRRRPPPRRRRPNGASPTAPRRERGMRPLPHAAPIIRGGRSRGAGSPPACAPPASRSAPPAPPEARWRSSDAAGNAPSRRKGSWRWSAPQPGS